jgi:short-subunit dehydrogenase involved in D-alanine esterification of teichoic acids
MRHRFKVRFEGEAVIEIDNAVINAVDDEWRSKFYQLYTPEDIALHVAYNMVINNAGLDRLDGFADQPEDNARIVTQPDWEVTAVRIQRQ